jgi:hypothetical protein
MGSGGAPAMSSLKAEVDARVVADIIAFAERHGWTRDHEQAVLEWLEEKLSRPNAAEYALGEALRICQRHGYPDTSFEHFLTWLDQRLEASDQAVLKEAELEPLPQYGASRVDTRPPGKFAQGLRQGQERSAQQAMLIMANDLQKAYERIGWLEEQLSRMKAEIGSGPPWPERRERTG